MNLVFELRVLSSSQTELRVRKVEILFSYKTCVAARLIDEDRAYVLGDKISKTTDRHLSTWVGSKSLLGTIPLQSEQFTAKAIELLTKELALAV